MIDTSGVPLIHLEIGKVIITEENVVIRTILGSCVSVVMFVPLRGLAMMCHAIYPGKGDCENLRYTIDAIARMDQEIQKNMISPRKVIVKLFGGGLQLLSNEREIVGTEQSENVQSAIDEIRRRGYNITSQNVGGYCSREVRFYTENGDVLLKRSSALRIKDIKGVHNE